MTNLKTYLTCAMIAGLAAPASATDTITIAGYGGAPAQKMREIYDSAFLEKNGIQVLQDDHNFAELAKVRAQQETNNLVWDVVMTVSINEAILCQEGLAEEIEWSKYLNAVDFAHIGGFGECGAPNITSPGVIAYDADRYPEDKAPKSLADFWDIEKFPGKRGMVYRPDETMEIALMADGVAPGDVAKVLISEGGVDRALAKLEELRPHIRWWKSGSESMQMLISGETVMTYTFPGRVYAANETNNRNLKIAWEAGYVTSPIYFVVLKGTPNLDAVIDYVSSALQPEMQAAYANASGYAPANEKAFDMIVPGGRLDEPQKYRHLGMVMSGEDYLTWYMDNTDMLHQRFSLFASETE